MTDEVLAACRAADAVLLGAVGGPKWDTTDPAKPRPEQGLLGMRKGLGLFANLRPVRAIPALYAGSPLREERIAGTDLLVVRELTGGIYFGAKERTATRASDLCIYTSRRSSGSSASRSARRGARVTSVDKANVLETSRLWREVVLRVHARGVPGGRARARARRQRRDGARRVALALRRDRHREHVRRHPQRRGGDDHRLDRDAAQRVARRRRARACSSPCTAPRPTSPAGASRTRSRCSSRSRCCCATGSGLRRRPPR